MDRVILVQTPEKFSHVSKIFCEEINKLGLVDKIYVASNAKNIDLPDNCKHIKLKKDYNFSGNMIRALPEVEEDIFLVCCEDHIPKGLNDPELWQKAFNFVDKHKDVGFLRLTYHEKVPVENKKKLFSKLDRSYEYYISLQPAIWRRKFFEVSLKDGEDAWVYEKNGSKRCRKYKKMKSFCSNTQVFSRTNFLKSGKYYRRQYIDYQLENNKEVDNSMKVKTKKGTMAVGDFIRKHRS